MKITKTIDTIKETYWGITLEIARSQHNEAFVEKFRRLSRPHKKQIDAQTLPMRKSTELVAEAMAGTVLVGWDAKEMERVAGRPYPFTLENAKALLVEDDDCREFVSTVAAAQDRYLLEEEEQLMGKSSAP